MEVPLLKAAENDLQNDTCFCGGSTGRYYGSTADAQFSQLGDEVQPGDTGEVGT